MSIFRESFVEEISGSLAIRQASMTNRTPQVIQYLNARNAWVKMTSSVNTGATTSNLDGTNTLAKNYVLSGGILTSAGNLRSGIGSGEEAYSTKTPGGTNHRLGIRPMPGITGVEIKSKSAYGSLREAVVSFQCWDVHQLEELEQLYMRPGYTVLLEWGWVPYLKNDGGVEYSFNDFYSDEIINSKGDKDRSVIFKELFDKSKKYGGNYDAIFGYVKNYNWSARADGGYDCSTTIITTGEIIESLKINYIRPDLQNYGLYDNSSTGKGYLDILFSNNGQLKSTVFFTEHYEKNTLAGVWNELYYKLKEGSTLSPAGQFLEDNYAVIPLEGLKNNGDANSMINPSDPNRVYITVKAAFDILNDFIIARSDSGNKEPLIKLSTRDNTYARKGSLLYSVAHPIQISVDPTVCLIKSTVWENDILPTAVTTARTSTATIDAQTKADAISKDLVKAADGSSFAGIVTDGTDEDLFLDAIKRIDSPLVFQLVNDYFLQGKDPNTNRHFKPGNTKGEGLQGLITDEFTESTKDGVSLPNGDYVEDDIVDLYYVSLMQQHFNNPGSGASLNFTVTNGTVSKDFKDYLRDDLKGNLPDTLEKAASVYGNIVPLNPKIGTFQYTTVWKISGLITISPSSVSTSAATTITVSSTDKSLAVVQKINKALGDKDYFYNKDPYTEVGIIENIFVNLDFLYKLSLSNQLESQDNKEKNEINLYSYLKSLASGIQTAIGNINSFEIHVDPIDNIGRIIDVNYTEPEKNKVKLFELQVQNLNSVVRNFSLQSQIFPNQSAIVAIGSQAKGGQLGIQNNTMVDFNTSLVDRVLKDKTFPKDDALAQNSNANPIMANSIASIINLLNAMDTSEGANIGDNVTKSKNALRDLIVYFQNLPDIKSSGANRNIIPTKFSFDMDGIGGLVIGNLFTVNQDVLPKGYKSLPNGTSKLAQTVTSIAHTIQNNDWVTKVDALNIILDDVKGNFKDVKLTDIVKNAIEVALQRASTPVVGSGSGTNTGGQSGGAPNTGNGSKGSGIPGTVITINSPLAKNLSSSGTRNLNSVTQIVLHHTNGYNDGESVFNTLINNGTSIHYAVDRGGGIWPGLPLTDIASHANDLNQYSVGIEICNIGYLDKTREGNYVDGYGKVWKPDFPGAFQQLPELANNNTPKGWGGGIADLGYKFNGYQYYEEYTDIQIQALRKVIRDILASCPNIKIPWKKNDYATIYKEVFGISLGSQGTNLSYNAAKLPKNYTGSGIFIHSRAALGTHTDTQPTLKLILLLNEFGT